MQLSSTKEILEQPVKDLLNFVQNFKKGKGLLIHGPVGCGKTSSIYALANELQYEVLEINASDTRSKNAVEEHLTKAVSQKSFFWKGKIILIDELDGLSGKQDRGAASAIAEIIERSSFPIICISQDPYIDKIAPIRKASKLLEYKELSPEAIYEVLTKEAKIKKIKYEEKALKQLARLAGGDLRAALIDLETLGNLEINDSTISLLEQRIRTSTIKQTLFKIFKTKDIKIARESFFNTDFDIDKALLWIDKNLPEEYSNDINAIERAYYYISRADAFKGRIIRRQQWDFLAYSNDLLSVGMALSKQEKNNQKIEYSEPTRLLSIWQANMKLSKKKSIAEKLSKEFHMSKKRFLQSWDSFAIIAQKDSTFRNELINKLDKEELDFMIKV